MYMMGLYDGIYVVGLSWDVTGHGIIMGFIMGIKMAHGDRTGLSWDFPIYPLVKIT